MPWPRPERGLGGRHAGAHAAPPATMMMSNAGQQHAQRSAQHDAQAPPAAMMMMRMSTAGQYAPRVDRDIRRRSPHPETEESPDIRALSAAWEGVQHKFLGLGRLAADRKAVDCKDSDTCSMSTSGTTRPAATTPPAKDLDKKKKKKPLRPCSFKRKLYNTMLEDSQKMILQNPEVAYLHNFEVLERVQPIEPCIKAKMYAQLDSFAAQVRAERRQAAAAFAPTAQVYSF